MKKNCLLVFIISFIATNITVAQTTILNEEFSNNLRNWEVGKDATENSQIRSGKYIMSNYQKNRWHWFAIDVDLSGSKNFLIDTKINRISSSSKHGIYGLVWGAKDANNAYAFLIDTNEQKYAAFNIFEGRWTTLVNWQKSYFINLNNAVNELVVAKGKGKLLFGINDNFVGSAPYQSFYGKKTGFFVGSKLKIFADNLLIKKWQENSSKPTTINKKTNSVSKWKGNGTGFFISPNGYIATNYHVVKDASKIEIEFERDGKKQNYKAKIIKSDKQNDLAIIKIDDSSFNLFKSIPYNFKSSIENSGTKVFALGYPLALSVMGTDIKFTDGKISSKTGFQGNISTYQTTTPIQPGNSGGPLFDFNGNLIGINSAKIRSDIADNVSYAIKSSYLKNLIDVLPTPLKLPNNDSLKNKKLTEKIKILSPYVVLIRVK